MTPRQRIVIRREMQKAEAAGDDVLLDVLRDDYEYDGVDTCAVDGMCQIACPVSINTGDLVRRLRQENTGALDQAIWKTASKHWDTIAHAGGMALTAADAAPAPLITGITRAGRAMLGADKVSLYNGDLPRGGHERRSLASPNPVAVYFPACIGTMFGPAADGEGVSDAFLTLCERAGVQVTVPEGVAAFCCGTPWKSKGYADGFEHMTDAGPPRAMGSQPRRGTTDCVRCRQLHRRPRDNARPRCQSPWFLRSLAFHGRDRIRA